MDDLDLDNSLGSTRGYSVVYCDLINMIIVSGAALLIIRPLSCMLAVDVHTGWYFVQNHHRLTFPNFKAKSIA